MQEQLFGNKLKNQTDSVNRELLHEARPSLAAPSLSMLKFCSGYQETMLEKSGKHAPIQSWLCQNCCAIQLRSLTKGCTFFKQYHALLGTFY